jgi:hypothetical protein
MMTIDQMRELLADFGRLPKIVKQPTYLELCKYPGRRFEEICSRLLAFYLDPKKEHGFHDLFLRSLFEMLNRHDISYKENDVTTELEVNAEGKRLDILVTGKSFAVGIENKIHAEVYNPLEKYKNLLEKEENKTKILLVLSMRKLNEKEVEKVREHNFLSYTYKEYFNVIKNKIGNYINHGNLKYLAFIADFIESIENIQGRSVMNKDIEIFFTDNAEKIEKMRELYDAFKNERWEKSVDRLYELQEAISKATNEKWSIFEDWLLSYESPCGIQVNVRLEETRENPLDNRHILIVMPHNNKAADEIWNRFSKKIKTAFPGFEVQRNENGIFLPVSVTPAGDNEAIMTKLQEVCTFLKNLAP